jgi:hypothetical protein
MNDPRKQAFLPYVRSVADSMRLRDWDLSIKEDPPSANCVASIWAATFSKDARICLAESFLDQSPEEQRSTIVHELIHLHFSRMNDTCVRELDPPSLRAFGQDFENGVEELAKSIAPFYPLPDPAAKPAAQ